MVRFSFELQLQDGSHLENLCCFDGFHIIIGASLISTMVSFRYINYSNDGNDNDTDITTTTITSIISN